MKVMSEQKVGAFHISNITTPILCDGRFWDSSLALAHSRVYVSASRSYENMFWIEMASSFGANC